MDGRLCARWRASYGPPDIHVGPLAPLPIPLRYAEPPLAASVLPKSPIYLIQTRRFFIPASRVAAYRLVSPTCFILLLFLCSLCCLDYRSKPLAVALGVASRARSSSPASTFAFVAFWPIGLAVRATSSVSILSRVVRVSSSTSAALRWAVGMGGRTMVARFG